MIAGIMSAQSIIPIQLVATANGQIAVLANGSTLPFSSPIGTSTTIQVTGTYIGRGKITIPQAPTILGSTAFTSVVNGNLPLTVGSGESFTFSITFLPTASTQASAVFSLPFVEATGGNGQPVVTTTGTISLQLVGAAPFFVLSYAKNGNIIPLSAGSAVIFDPQPINTTVTQGLNVTNTGSATGQVTGITISGAAFKLIGTPLFPASVPAGQTLQVGIQYTPTAVASDTGNVEITYAGGGTASVPLQGSGISSVLVYTLIINGKSTVVPPNGTVTLPDTNIGSISSGVIRVQNTGGAPATIGSINLAGPNFQLSGLPVFPKILNKNDSFTFTITFAPTDPGPAKGQLFIGTDTFNLTGNGLGSQLQFSYTAGGSSQVVGQNGVTAIVFSPVQVASDETIPVTVTNKGTLATVISNIAVGENNSAFSLSGLPAKLPLSLKPGGTVSFNLIYAPKSTGVSTGTLLVNTSSVPLSGSATAPPKLPAYTISGPSGNVKPQTQPGVTLKLVDSYPVALEGVLTLTTSGSLGTDPAVQFSTGGRTVPFTIAANGTSANFAGQGTQILLQTGTVAEEITLTPSFVTAQGGVDLTPDNPATLQFAIPAGPPVLLAGLESANTDRSVTLTFAGYSTTRSLTALNVQFIPANGFTLTTSQITVDLSQASAVWFDGTSSQSFGGQFTVTVPFTFSGTVPNGVALIQTIASFTATLSNESGVSNSVSGPIQ